MQNLSLAWCTLHWTHSTLLSRTITDAGSPVSELLLEPEAGRWDRCHLSDGEGILSSVCTVFSFAALTSVNALMPACADDAKGAPGWQRSLVSLAARILCTTFFSLIVSPLLVIAMTRNAILWPPPPQVAFIPAQMVAACVDRKSRQL